MAEHHCGARQPMGGNVVQRHLTLEQEPPLAKLLVPRHPTSQRGEVQEVGAGHEKKHPLVDE